MLYNICTTFYWGVVLEVWKAIRGYTGLYEVSSTGKVKCLNTNTIKIRPHINKYVYVSLTKKGVSKSYLVHRLVARSFIKNKKYKPQVNHINGIKNDNRVQNLEWCTASENIQHALAAGLIKYPKGENKPNTKFTNEDVLKIRKNHLDGVSSREIALKYNVTQQAIHNIVTRKNWKHI